MAENRQFVINIVIAIINNMAITTTTTSPSALSVAPTAPSTSSTSSTRPDSKQVAEMIGRQIGYTGEYGGGKYATWLAANPDAKAKGEHLSQPIASSGFTRGEMQNLGRQVGYTGEYGSGGFANYINNSTTQNPDAVVDYYNKWRQQDNSFYFTPESQSQYNTAMSQKQYNTFLKEIEDQVSRMYQPTPVGYQNDQPAKLTRPEAKQLPSTLQSLRDMSDIQQRSAIATDAIYGAGADEEAKGYYLNMLQRSLMDDQGNIQNFDSLLPIERNYLQLLGLPISSGNDFLSGLTSYMAAGQ